MKTETIAIFIEKATSRMCEDIQAVGPDEHAREAATRIVLTWDEQDELLDEDDSDLWEDQGPTSTDHRALFDGCIDAVENAIAQARGDAP